MARVPIRPDTERSSEPTADIIDEMISGRIRHLSIRKNKSPKQNGEKTITGKFIIILGVRVIEIFRLLVCAFRLRMLHDQLKAKTLRAV